MSTSVVTSVPAATDPKVAALQGILRELGRDADISSIRFNPDNPVDVAVVDLATLLFGPRDGVNPRERQTALENALAKGLANMDARTPVLKSFIRDVVNSSEERTHWFSRLNPRRGEVSGGVLATLKNNLSAALY